MFTLFHKLLRKDRELVKAITNVTNITPDNVYLYSLALTHTSFVRQQGSGKQDTNERLEFLGDSILGAVVAEFLYKKFPYKDEGFLTEMRSRIVNRESLNHIALKIGLNTLLKIDQQNQATHLALMETHSPLIRPSATFSPQGRREDPLCRASFDQPKTNKHNGGDYSCLGNCF